VFVFTPSLIGLLRAAGVGVYAVDELSLQKGRYLHEIILGYCHLSGDEIKQGVAILKRVLDVE
jgi:GntR family transcriptional regulator/MocR family aminotransferase